jgi:hypothetical protein
MIVFPIWGKMCGEKAWGDLGTMRDPGYLVSKKDRNSQWQNVK